jgi:hypothetical protein
MTIFAPARRGSSLGVNDVTKLSTGLRLCSLVASIPSNWFGVTTAVEVNR